MVSNVLPNWIGYYQRPAQMKSINIQLKHYQEDFIQTICITSTNFLSCAIAFKNSVFLPLSGSRNLTIYSFIYVHLQFFHVFSTRSVVVIRLDYFWYVYIGHNFISFVKKISHGENDI